MEPAPDGCDAATLEADAYCDAFSAAFTTIDWDGPLGFEIVPTQPNTLLLRAICLRRGESIQSNSKNMEHLSSALKSIDCIFYFRLSTYYVRDGLHVVEFDMIVRPDWVRARRGAVCRLSDLDLVMVDLVCHDHPLACGLVETL